MATRVYSANDLYLIARNQRWLLLLILTNILAYIGCFILAASTPEDPNQVSPAIGILFLVLLCLIVLVALLWVVVAVLLMVSLKTSVVTLVFFIIGSFLPLIGFLVLLTVSSMATRALKNAGHKVGLIGVSGATLKQLKAASQQVAPPMPATR